MKRIFCLILLMCSVVAYSQPKAVKDKKPKTEQAVKTVLDSSAINHVDTVAVVIMRFDTEGYLQRLAGFVIVKYQTNPALTLKGPENREFYDAKFSVIRPEDIYDFQVVPRPKG